MLEDLSHAFGGHSQVPDHVVGLAIAGHLTNGLLCNALPLTIIEEVNRVIDAIYEKWQDQNLNFDDVKKEVIRGLKDGLKDSIKSERNQELFEVISVLEK